MEISERGSNETPGTSGFSQDKNGYGLRIGKLIGGLVLFAIGSYLVIQANIGLAPWEAFSVGVSQTTGVLYGDVIFLSGLLVLAVDLLLKEKIGLGTVMDILIIGKVVDLLRWLKLVPLVEHFWLGVVVLLVGQLIICVGTVLYIGSGFGCGPRDALMMALSKRMPRVPIGAIRGTIEGAVLLIGWILGAKVGLGTVISVFGIGFLLQFTFHVLRFDASRVRQEDLLTTIKGICRRKPAETNG